jgi:tetratricopeptide (TPR) repeat protein
MYDRRDSIELEIERRQQERAADPLRVLRALDLPPGGSPLLDEAIDAVAGGDFARAAERFRMITVHGHLQLGAIASIGLAHVAAAEGRPSEANELLGNAITFGSSATGELAKVGVARLIRTDDHGRAFELLRGACGSANQAVAHEAGVERVSLLLEHSRYDEAVHVLDRFVYRNDPGLPERTRRLIDAGRASLAAGDAAGARRAFEDARTSGDPLGAYYLGRLAVGEDRFAEASRAYRAAIDSGHPDVAPQATLELGGLLEQRGRYEEAAKWYRQVEESGKPALAAKASKRRENLRLSRRIREND